jgi:glucosamine 6-phosphate synthetase-like amidotransferase/phosphosugar isomerase protein
MCGIFAIAYGQTTPRIGQIAIDIGARLDYRGHDSAGVAVFNAAGHSTQPYYPEARLIGHPDLATPDHNWHVSADGTILLVKNVGSSSQVYHSAKVDQMTGSIAAGQVRWATFGGIDKVNAQPHFDTQRVLVGAHNGNIINAFTLRQRYIEQGLAVQSHNDGEITVHAFAYRYHQNRVAGMPVEEAMRKALQEGANDLVGSYAAFITGGANTNGLVWAVKQGSSLYLGIGRDDNGPFTMVSSDLTSVLDRTRMIVPLNNGEGVEFDANHYQIFSLGSGRAVSRAAIRSNLKPEHTKLDPYPFYMEKEIFEQPAVAETILRKYSGGSQESREILRFLSIPSAPLEALTPRLSRIINTADIGEAQAQFEALIDAEEMNDLVTRARAIPEVASYLGATKLEQLKSQFRSDDAEDLARLALNVSAIKRERAIICAKLFDAIREITESQTLAARLSNFVNRLKEAENTGGRVFFLASGTSYHAAKIGATFFNKICGSAMLVCKPEEFDGSYRDSLSEKDVMVYISQSGETKDVIASIDYVKERSPALTVMGLVNNINSTLAQEKTSEGTEGRKLYLPLFCGLEIAVPATKSFMNQVVLLLHIAVHLGEMKGRNVTRYAEMEQTIPALLTNTLAMVDQPIRDLAAELARVKYLREAKRAGEEDGIEVKKDRATLDALAVTGTVREALEKDLREKREGKRIRTMHILGTTTNFPTALEGALKMREVVLTHVEGVDSTGFKHGPNTILPGNPRDWSEWYPLIYITSSAPEDIETTIAQINTHNIRGAQTITIAPKNARLREETIRPVQIDLAGEYIQGHFIAVPDSDPLLSSLPITIALQLLAYRWAVLEEKDPDQPRNVSKSITVK